MNDNKVVVIYSGGMDSFTLVHELVQQYEPWNVFPVSFSYGQRHARELDNAVNECMSLGLEHKVVDLSDLKNLLSASALTGNTPVPEGHYEQENMKLTVVPNRNMIMLSIAAGYAVSIGAGKVYFGAHAGDHAIYPDCRPQFVMELNTALHSANYEAPRVYAPYITLSKGEILQRGLNHLGLSPSDYANTWTCYKGDRLPCGKCGSCTERLEAFAHAGVVDPLPYE